MSDSTARKKRHRDGGTGGGCLIGVIAVAVVIVTAATGGSGGHRPAGGDGGGRPGAAAWYAAAGRGVLDGVTRDLTAIGADRRDRSPAALRPDCAALSADLASAGRAGPIPDRTAQRHWSSALTQLSEASHDCAAGASAADTARLSRAAGEIAQVTTRLRTISEVAG